MKALTYLLVYQWKGAILNTLRSGVRTLMGLLAFAWVFGQIVNSLVVFSSIGVRGRLPFQTAIPFPMLRGVILFLLAAAAYGILAKGIQGKLVTFGAADIDFLFAMPFRQRLVLGFRLFLNAMQYLGWILLGALWASPILANLLGVPVSAVLWRMVLALFFSVVFLICASHAIYIFYAYRVRASEALNWVVKWGGGIAAVGILLVVGYDASYGETPYQQMIRFLNHPVTLTLLWPLTIAVDAILSAHPRFEEVGMRNLVILAGLAIGAIAAALGQKENVYEPSLAVSLRRARLQEAMRSGGVSAMRMEVLRDWYERRSARGWKAPEIGVGWKALMWKTIQIWMHAPWMGLSLVLLVSIAIPVLLHIYLPPRERDTIVPGLPMVWMMISWILGASIIHWVRGELTQGAFLKTIPVSPHRITLSFSLIPIVAFTLTLWTFLAMLAILFGDVYQPFLLPLVFVGPPLMAALTHFHVLVAILFPSAKDPAHRLLSGLMLLPGWFALYAAPVGLAALIFVGVFGTTGMRGGSDTVALAFAMFIALEYVGLALLLLWWAGIAFRSYSPADE